MSLALQGSMSYYIAVHMLESGIVKTRRVSESGVRRGRSPDECRVSRVKRVKLELDAHGLRLPVPDLLCCASQPSSPPCSMSLDCICFECCILVSAMAVIKSKCTHISALQLLPGRARRRLDEHVLHLPMSATRTGYTQVCTHTELQ